MKNEKIPKTPEELVANSGNTLTIRIRDFLKKEGWSTTLSPYYVDPLTNKTRENDIIATKTKMAQNLEGHNVPISVALVIECKYIKENAVFWFDPMNIAKATNSKNSHNQNTHYFGLHTLSLGLDGNPKPVAKLFDDGDTSQNKPFYTGIDQCLHGLLSSRERKFGGKFFDKGRIFLEYPVLLVNDFTHLYDSQCQNLAENFLFEVDYSYSKNNEVQNEYFLVDIVNEKLLEKFLQVIDDDIYSLVRGVENFAQVDVNKEFGV